MLARGHACDADAAVTSAKTVNGRIALGAHATAGSLYVSDRATVGTVTGATAIPFSGDSPPN
jgi:hypothetical protein